MCSLKPSHRRRALGFSAKGLFGRPFSSLGEQLLSLWGWKGSAEAFSVCGMLLGPKDPHLTRMRAPSWGHPLTISAESLVPPPQVAHLSSSSCNRIPGGLRKDNRPMIYKIREKAQGHVYTDGPHAYGCCPAHSTASWQSPLESPPATPKFRCQKANPSPPCPVSSFPGVGPAH